MRKNLKEYYDKVLRCKKCGKFYGSDKPTDNKICPACYPTQSIRNYSDVENEKNLSLNKKHENGLSTSSP